MIVLPAIDVMAGVAVRLRQGDPQRRTTVGDDPVALARRWADEGAPWLHVVDLDGAMAGAPRHLDLLARLCAAVPVPVQVGGGLRSMADLQAVFDAGAARAVLGTAALDAQALSAAVGAFGDRMAVALDIADGLVATDGWQRRSGVPALEAGRWLAAAGAARLIYTDVRRDGMLVGPDLDGLQAILAAVSIPVILSGGVTALEDVRAAAAAGAEGVIIGRALYDGRIALADALAAGRGA